MRQKLTNNFALKLMSVVVAIVIWLIVVNVDDPITTKRFTGIKPQIVNEAYIEKSGMMYMQSDEASTTVVITGRRKLLQRISYADVIATADLRQAVSLETSPVMIPVTVNCRGIDPDKIQVSPPNIAIELEEKQTQEFLVNVNSQDSKPGKGYEIGTLVASPEKIRITGPESLMRKIDRVVAYVSVSGIVTDKTEQVDLKIIDKNQEEFTQDQMKYLKFDTSRVNISVGLWRIKTDVQIVGSCSGIPKYGYKTGNIVMTPGAVSVTGTEEALELLKEQGNCIEIPAELLDVTEQDGDFEIKVDLSTLLPENLRLTTDTQSNVLAKITILPEDSKDYNIPTKDIVIKHLPKGQEAVFETEKVCVRVEADEFYSIEDLEPKDIQVKIDLANMAEGNYEMPLQIHLPEGYHIVSDVTTEVRLSEINEES